ncbi:MAG: hypothetical protein LBF24_01725 [Puniceicoccales bacterium]|nr:hypothetical protein [Puniceicoccales bacterium]
MGKKRSISDRMSADFVAGPGDETGRGPTGRDGRSSHAIPAQRFGKFLRRLLARWARSSESCGRLERSGPRRAGRMDGQEAVAVLPRGGTTPKIPPPAAAELAVKLASIDGVRRLLST